MAYDKRAGVIFNPGCSNNCIFCGDNPRRTDKEIRKQEVGIYKDILGYRRNGFTKLEISGGDPLEYAKLPAFVRYARQIGFKDVTLATHGRGLSNKQLARELIEAGIDTFRIPLYGSNAEIHESITKAKRSFEESVGGIKNIKKMKPSVGLMIHTLVLQQNKEDLLNIFKLALGLKMDKFCISVLCIAADGYYNFYVPYKSLRQYIAGLIGYTADKNIGNVYFNDIPYCIFGFDNRQVVMTTPPDLGNHNQPPADFRSEIRNLPRYRLKTKAKICESCSLSYKCEGFYLNDVKKFGTGSLKPVT